MYNSLKKVFWILGIISFMGNFSFGQNWTEINLSNNTTKNSSYNRNNTTNTNTNNTTYWSKPTMMQDKSLETPDTYGATPKELCEKTAPKGARVWSDAVGICNCPDWKKRVDKKGCIPCSDASVCCGIELNTKVPFIGNCIEFSKKCSDTSPCSQGYTCTNGKCKLTTVDPNKTSVSEEEAFPTLMGGLTKILVTVILLIGFMGILIGGIMISASWGNDSNAWKGKELIGKVIIALALLGASGVILKLINPNFFW